GVDDRLADELRQRLLGLLRVLRQLVEVRADRSLRSCGRVRVAGVAALSDENALPRSLLLERANDGLGERADGAFAAAPGEQEDQERRREEHDRAGAAAHGARVYCLPADERPTYGRAEKGDVDRRVVDEERHDEADEHRIHGRPSTQERSDCNEYGDAAA